MHPAARTRRIIGADELLFLLLWSSGYIGSKIGLPLSGTFTLLFFRYVIALLLVGPYVSLRSEWHWPDQRSLLIGFLGHFLWLIAVLKALEFGISAGSAARCGPYDANAADYVIIILAAFGNADLPCPARLLGRRVCG